MNLKFRIPQLSVKSLVLLFGTVKLQCLLSVISLMLLTKAVNI